MSRRKSQSTSNGKTIELIKVDLKDTERDGKFQLRTFGKKITKPAISLADSKFKKRVGREGFMMVEDYQKGAFAEYGLDPKRIQGFTEKESLEKENEILRAKLAELESKKDEPKKEDKKSKKEEDPK